MHGRAGDGVLQLSWFCVCWHRGFGRSTLDAGRYDGVSLKSRGLECYLVDQLYSFLHFPQLLVEIVGEWYYKKCHVSASVTRGFAGRRSFPSLLNALVLGSRRLWMSRCQAAMCERKVSFLQTQATVTRTDSWRFPLIIRLRKWL